MSGNLKVYRILTARNIRNTGMRHPWNWERSGCHRRNREFPKDVIDLLDGQSHLPTHPPHQQTEETTCDELNSRLCRSPSVAVVRRHRVYILSHDLYQ